MTLWPAQAVMAEPAAAEAVLTAVEMAAVLVVAMVVTMAVTMAVAMAVMMGVMMVAAGTPEARAAVDGGATVVVPMEGPMAVAAWAAAVVQAAHAAGVAGTG